MNALKSLVPTAAAMTALLSVLTTVVSPVEAGTISQMTWVWSVSSAPVSNSTAALATGHTKRAIRLATRALGAVSGPDRVIALHNLCLAWLADGEPAKADPHCTEAIVAIAGEPGLSPKDQAAILANIELARRQLNAKRDSTVIARNITN